MAALAPDGSQDSDSQRGLSVADLALQKLQTKLKLLTETDSLSLADSFIGDAGCLVLARFVKEKTGVKTLDLRGNNIGAEGMKTVAGLLKPPTALEDLNLEWNNAHLGLAPLAEALATNSTLQTLDLRNNKLGPEASAQLARALATNTTLQKLDLRWNDLGLEGVKPFISLLEARQSGLKQLELSGNKAPEDAIRQVEALLKGESNPQQVFEESLTSPRRRTETAQVHPRNRSSGTYRRRDLEIPQLLTHTRLETQIADLEFALEQERRRNADLVAALANEQTDKSDAESKCMALQDILEKLQASFEAEKQELESQLAEEQRFKEETAEALQIAKENLGREQAYARAQVKDVEVRVVELQEALESTEKDLTEARDFKAREVNEAVATIKADLESQIRLKDSEISRLIDQKEKLTNENRVFRGELVQSQEQSKQSLTALETQLREDETRRFNATFHSLDQKLRSVQDLRDSLQDRCQDLQRELMKAEKKAVEQALAFELERGKAQDQYRELCAQNRALQTDLSVYQGQCEGLKSTCESLENETDELKQRIADQSNAFQQHMGEMMTDQRGEREQWEQQQASTLQRIQALEGELLLCAAEKRKAMDEFVRAI